MDEMKKATKQLVESILLENNDKVIDALKDNNFIIDILFLLIYIISQLLNYILRNMTTLQPQEKNTLTFNFLKTSNILNKILQ